MGRHKIYVALSESGISNAITQLTAYQNTVEQKKKDILNELAKLGQEVATATYNSSHINVGIDSLDNGYRFRIYAEGEIVCFLEFGAGTRTEVAHPFADKVPFDVIPGSWSEEHSKQFSTKGYWKFGGVRYEYVTPRKGLYEADVMIQQRVVYIARKVFGYD